MKTLYYSPIREGHEVADLLLPGEVKGLTKKELKYLRKGQKIPPQLAEKKQKIWDSSSIKKNNDLTRNITDGIPLPMTPNKWPSIKEKEDNSPFCSPLSASHNKKNNIASPSYKTKSRGPPRNIRVKTTTKLVGKSSKITSKSPKTGPKKWKIQNTPINPKRMDINEEGGGIKKSQKRRKREWSTPEKPLTGAKWDEHQNLSFRQSNYQKKILGRDVNIDKVLCMNKRELLEFLREMGLRCSNKMNKEVLQRQIFT